MAVGITNTAVAKAGNGLGSTTTIIVTNAAVANDAALAVIVNEIGVEGHTIAGVAGTANNAGVMHFAIQGGVTPAITGCTVVAAFQQDPA
mgnify:FL=1|tara:strand:- start:195 stop:464 length:270 start_codon:yes stop_codon:yes gene_type:complete